MQTSTGAHWYLVNGLLVWINKACDGPGVQNVVGIIKHLLDRTSPNIIFIWSGKVILGLGFASPNITLPDQINMILVSVLSNNQRYDEANHRNILNDFEWVNIRYLVDYDLGVLMYKTVNGHGREICKESFHGISSFHEHATRSAVKGDLYVPRKTRLWNMIPSTIRNAQSIDIFKVKLKEHYLNLQKAQQ